MHKGELPQAGAALERRGLKAVHQTEPNRPVMLGLLVMHKLPWKTIGLVAVVTLVVLWVVNNINPLGIRSIVNPTPTA